MQLGTKLFFSILICSSITVPLLVNAAAQVPITQEEIEAILQREQVENVSSSTLPDDLKKRLGQTVASTTDAIKPVITDTIDKAEQAIATATNQISSTSDKIKNNLESIQAQATADLKETFLNKVVDFFTSTWQAIIEWFDGFFRGKPLTGATK